VIREKNRFGDGVLYESGDICGDIYAACTACMNIYSEFLTWANAYKHRIVERPADADSIIVLSCQVTDLSILNDLRYLEKFHTLYPKATCYIGGCLARRFDIPLPSGVRRLVNVRADGVQIDDKSLVHYADPFWVVNFKESDDELSDGHLFRNMYPLRISVGCSGNCTFCSIHVTRGEAYELASNEQEFLDHDDVLLVADSPSAKLLKRWVGIATKHNKPISIRNVEPPVAVSIVPELFELADKGLLKVLHCAIQSNSPEVLGDMHRPVEATLDFIAAAMGLRRSGVTLATCIITDYKDFPNPDMDLLYKTFHYISWNPYWDGEWDRAAAGKRWEKYLPYVAKFYTEGDE